MYEGSKKKKKVTVDREENEARLGNRDGEEKRAGGWLESEWTLRSTGSPLFFGSFESRVQAHFCLTSASE